MYKKILLTSIVINFYPNLFSQITSTTSTSLNDSSVSKYFKGADVVITKTAKPATFSTDKDAWSIYLKSKLNTAVPLINKAVPGTYQVIIRFIVGKDSSLRNFDALSNCGYGLENEVIRCLKQCPKWNPALTSDGLKVSTVINQVVTFIIKGDKVNILIH